MESRARKLETQIRYHRDLYDAGKPTISDAEFDLLVDELRELNPHSTALDYLGKPTGRKVQHTRPMLSLKKAYESSELDHWFDSVVESYGDVGDAAVVMPKLDGVSCSLVYESGRLVSAATRGNGKTGESIIHLIAGSCVPKYLSPEMRALASDDQVTIRGELIIRKNTFEERLSATYANARNCVAGLLGKIDKTPDHAYIDFVLYDMFPTRCESFMDLLFRINQLNQFVVVYSYRVDRASVSLPNVAEDVFGYEEDGKVLRADRMSTWEQAGATSHHPNGSIAWKYRTDSRWANVRDVLWQVSRTGTITPVIEVDPVQLSGVTVSRATMHHAANFLKLAPRVGTTAALLTRRGGVIPHIEQIDFIEEGGEPYKLPKKCPSCGGAVARDGFYLRCVAPKHCPDAVISTIVYFARAMGYDGLGPGLAASAYIDGVLNKPVDLYTFIPGTFRGVEGWGSANVNALKQGMPRKVPSWKFLQALGIDGFGKTQSQRVLEHFGSVPNIMRWAAENSADPDIQGIGETMLWNLREYFIEYREDVTDLLNQLEIEDEVKTTGPLSGKSFVFTGRLTDMERADAQAAVRALGADTPSGVTKTLTYLVVGDLANDKQISKRTKAAKYNASGSNIKIIEEEEFVDLLRKHTTL